MKFVLPYDFTLASKSSLAVEFKADVPTFVPDVVHAEAIALGAVPSDEPDDIVPGNQMPSDEGAAA